MRYTHQAQGLDVHRSILSGEPISFYPSGADSDIAVMSVVIDRAEFPGKRQPARMWGYDEHDQSVRFEIEYDATTNHATIVEAAPVELCTV